MHLLLSTTCLWDFYRVKISIALPIQSLDPIRSLDHSLSTRLIPAGAFKNAGGHGISIALAIHSFDSTLQM